MNAGDPIVTINNPTGATANFVAPVVASPLSLTFQLTVGTPGINTPSTANVAVPIALTPPDSAPGVSASANPNPAIGDGTSIITLNATGVDPNGGTITYNWTAPAGITFIETGTGTGTDQRLPSSHPACRHSAPLVLNFTVVATSSVAGVPASAPSLWPLR